MLHQVDNSCEKMLYRIHVCKISMWTYVKKLTDILQIDEYVGIHVIDIYDMKTMGKYSLS